MKYLFIGQDTKDIYSCVDPVLEEQNKIEDVSFEEKDFICLNHFDTTSIAANEVGTSTQTVSSSSSSYSETGKFGRCLCSKDSLSMLCTLKYTTDFNINDFTIEFWAKIDPQVNSMKFVDIRTQNVSTGIPDEILFISYLQDPTVIEDFTLTFGAGTKMFYFAEADITDFTHIAYTRKENNVYIHINGKYCSTNNINIVENLVEMYVSFSGTNLFVDELAIFNFAKYTEKDFIVPDRPYIVKKSNNI